MLHQRLSRFLCSTKHKARFNKASVEPLILLFSTDVERVECDADGSRRPERDPIGMPSEEAVGLTAMLLLREPGLAAASVSFGQ